MKNPFNKEVTEKTLRKQYRKDALKRIEQLYTVADSICKEWDKNSLPLLTFREITKNAKLSYSKKHKKQFPILANMEKDFNSLIETLYHTAAKDCKMMISKELPLTKLKEYKDEIIKGFKEGVEEKLKR